MYCIAHMELTASYDIDQCMADRNSRACMRAFSSIRAVVMYDSVPLGFLSRAFSTLTFVHTCHTALGDYNGIDDLQRGSIKRSRKLARVLPYIRCCTRPAQRGAAVFILYVYGVPRCGPKK